MPDKSSQTNIGRWLARAARYEERGFDDRFICVAACFVARVAACKARCVLLHFRGIVAWHVCCDGVGSWLVDLEYPWNPGHREQCSIVG